MNGPSPNLSWSELACHDGTPYPEEWRSTRLVLLAGLFEDFRLVMGDRPLIIGSAYRTPKWNRRYGGAIKSQHLEGCALDIRRPSKQEVQKFCQKAKAFANNDERVGGLGWYSWGVHIDIRPRKNNRLAYWNRIRPGTRLHDSDIRNA